MARKRLLANGWVFEEISCSEKMVCTEYAELATNLNDASTCAEFRRTNEQLQLCVAPIPEGFRVADVKLKD